MVRETEKSDEALFRAQVIAFPWSFFCVPVAFLNRDLALVAWHQIGFVLSAQADSFSPESTVGDERWAQFMKLLMGKDYALYPLMVGNRKSWKEAVAAINGQLAAYEIPLASAELPEFG